MGTDERGNLACQVVGTAHVSTQYRDDIISQRVDAYHGRVGMFVLDIMGDGSGAYAQGADKHEGVVVFPIGPD